MRRTIGVALAVFALGVTGLSAPQAGEDLEYKVKAALLLNFTKFIEWPTPSGANFVVGVIGGDPFGFALDRVMDAKTVKNRPILVRRMARLDEIRECDLLFVSASERKRVREVLDAVGRRPILTVSDLDGFARNGGMIQFFMEADRIRFEVNVHAAQNSGLRFRSQLLELARITEGAKNR